MIRFEEEELEDSSGSTDQHILVVGGGRFGLATADQLARQFDEVSFAGDVDTGADDEETPVRIVSRLPATLGDVRVLREDLGHVDAILALGRDHQSLWSAHILRRELGVDVTVATLEDPRLRSTFSGTGVEPILLSELLADHLFTLTTSHVPVTQ